MATIEDEALEAVARNMVAALGARGETQHTGARRRAGFDHGLLEHDDLRWVMRALGVGAEAPADVELVSVESDWVGIWRRREASGGFERAPERAGEWHLWADVAEIPAKGRRTRVAYIGESTARGYFYDPAFTPARALEQMLAHAGLPGGVEVVDLARSDLAFEGDLSRLLASARALQPDAYVVFAGNNRKLPLSSLKSPPSRPAVLAEVLRRGGVQKLRSLVDSWREREVANIVATLAGLGRPVLVILPEFNLGDWRNEASGDVPWLPGDANQRWFEARARASAALERGDMRALESCAAQMLGLDQGSASAGLELLAECARRRGEEAERRAYIERARDAHMSWDFASPETPRLDAVTKAALVRGLDAAGIATVDCAEIFADHLDGQAPDRRLFLDYCHLTSEGLRLVMAHAAGALARALGHDAGPTDALLAVAPTPAPAVEAEARFAAAIHNAHWGQGFDIVHHHCARAVELAVELVPVLEAYLDLATTRTPNWMCRSMDRLLRMGRPALVKYVLGYGAVSLLDATLTDAIAEAIVGERPAARAHLHALRAREYGLEPGVREDLLALQYAPSFMDREWARSGVAGAVEASLRPVVKFHAHAPVSRFVFVCDGRERVELELVARLVDVDVDVDSPEPAAEIFVNGVRQAQAVLSHDWSVSTIAVAREVLTDGLNVIELRWPTWLITGERGVERAADKLLQARGSTRLIPTYAMIHSLTATMSETENHA